jgi:adenosylmethionine-8-amino-7-oxononanoate aminotransferase
VTNDTVIFAPAFIAERKHIDEMFDKVRRVVSRHAQRAGVRLVG